MRVEIPKETLEFFHKLAVIMWDELFNEIVDVEPKGISIDGQKWRLN